MDIGLSQYREETEQYAHHYNYSMVSMVSMLILVENINARIDILTRFSAAGRIIVTIYYID